MNHQDLKNTRIFEQIQGLLFSDLSGPLSKSPCSLVPLQNKRKNMGQASFTCTPKRKWWLQCRNLNKL